MKCFDDVVITTKVKSLLAEDDFLKSFQISVEIYKSVVQLICFEYSGCRGQCGENRFER